MKVQLPALTLLSDVYNTLVGAKSIGALRPQLTFPWEMLSNVR